jgi:hypothetical protein
MKRLMGYKASYNGDTVEVWAEDPTEAKVLAARLLGISPQIARLNVFLVSLGRGTYVEDN